MTGAGAARQSETDARVMLVEDSAVVRGMVRGWLDGLKGVEVVAAADNGQVALNKVKAARPDVIILDIEMPVMDGLTALPGLLRGAPEARILVASTLSRRNAEVTLKAMSLGAADYLAKPSFARDGNDARAMFREELLRKVSGLAGLDEPKPDGQGTVSAASRSKGSTAEKGSGAKANPSVVKPAVSSSQGNQRWGAIPSPDTSFATRAVSKVTPRILVIGSSTGGPAALNRFLGDIKSQLERVPVLITQHMPPTFTTLLGESLCRLTGLEGGEAKDGEPVVAGRLYVAPGGFHMQVVQKQGKQFISLMDGPPINHCKPAVDPMFSSVAAIYRGSALGVVLTGMGTDGAQGALEIADAGGSVFAQDEKTSIVWGMPGAAMAAGACVEAIGLEKLGARIGNLLMRKGK